MHGFVFQMAWFVGQVGRIGNGLGLVPGQTHLNHLPVQHLDQIALIPSSPPAPGLDAEAAGCLLTQQRQCDAPDQGQIRRRMVLAHAAGVLGEAHVQRPVQLVFHRPVRTHGFGQSGGTGTQWQAAQVVVGLTGHFFAAAALAHHLGQGLEVLPAGGVGLEVVRHLDQPVLTTLLAPVSALFADGFVVVMCATGEVLLLTDVPERVDLVVQVFVIALQRQHVVGLAGADGRGDALLAAHRVDGDDAALDRQQLQQRRNRRDFVGLLLGAHLPEQQALRARPGTDDVQRRAFGRARAAHALAVDRHHIPRLDARRQRPQPGRDHLLQLIRIKPREHPRKGVVRGDAAGQLQKPRKPLALGMPELGDLVPVFGAPDHRADRDRQDVEQLVPAGALDARIAHAFEVFKQAGLDSGAHGRTEEMRAGRRTMPS